MLLRIETYSAPAWEPGADEVTARSGAATGDVRLEVESAPVEDVATDGGGPHRVAAHAGTMWAVDGATGRPVSKVFPHGGVHHTPTAVGGSVHVGNNKGLVAMDAATGEAAWGGAFGATRRLLLWC
ncbi:hypothetical protein OG223_52710 [Streptomyces sp. NBC_01478]|uniref:hypothetical protein n=1 Tax=Streptomyces sp. NBC_01478 TaxID=2903882 RepID=UPI002E2EA66F|nr:hypothetical protein [Streptomyces sp. NBC_01478]